MAGTMTNQWEIQRNLVTIRELLASTAVSLSDFWGDDAPQVIELKRIEVRVGRVENSIRKGFEPDK